MKFELLKRHCLPLRQFFFFFIKIYIFDFFVFTKVWSTLLSKINLFFIYKNLNYRLQANRAAALNLINQKGDAALDFNQKIMPWNFTKLSKYADLFKIKFSACSIIEKPNLESNASATADYGKNTLFPKLMFFIFKFFFLFNYSFINLNFFGNSAFNHYSLNFKGTLVRVTNYRKFFAKWLVFYAFSLNIFFFQFSSLLLTAPFFKSHSQAWNWKTTTWSIYLWRYFFHFFLFKTPTFDQKRNFFFLKFKEYQLYYFFISDALYHVKNIFYLKKNNYYTIGLINSNENPFLLHYSVLSFFNNFLTQFFFLKFLYYIKKHSAVRIYKNYKLTWIMLKQSYALL